MAKQIQLSSVDPLPEVNLAKLELLQCVPPWMATLRNAASKDHDGNPTWEPEPRIPASLMPTGPQRQAIEEMCSRLERAEEPGPEATMATMISRLVEFYATGATNVDSGGIKLRGYMLAVDDLPAWSVANAVRHWFRGKCGQRNYEFAPSPAVLRELAEREVKIVRGHLATYRRLLKVKALDVVSDEERTRVAALMDCFNAEMEKIAEANSMKAASRRDRLDDSDDVDTSPPAAISIGPELRARLDARLGLEAAE